MGSKRLEYNLKEFDYFRRNIKITCLSEIIKNIVFILTICIIILLITVNITLLFSLNIKEQVDKLLGKYNFSIVSLFIVTLLLGVYFIIKFITKIKLNKIYKRVYELYLSDIKVYQERIIYKRGNIFLVFLALNKEEQRKLEKAFLNKILTNEDLLALTEKFLLFREGIFEQKRIKKFQDKILELEEELKEYNFIIDRFFDEDKNSVYSYYIKINNQNIRVGNKKAILSKDIFSNERRNSET